MRTLFLNMTMSLDGYVAGPNGELDWMTTQHDAELTADIVSLLRRADEGFIGFPTAEPMIRYWADVAGKPRRNSGIARHRRRRVRDAYLRRVAYRRAGRRHQR